MCRIKKYELLCLAGLMFLGGCSSGTTGQQAGQSPDSAVTETEEAFEPGKRHAQDKPKNEGNKEAENEDAEKPEVDQDYEKLMLSALDSAEEENSNTVAFKTVQPLVQDFIIYGQYPSKVYYPNYENVTVNSSEFKENVEGYSTLVFGEYFVDRGSIVKKGDPVFSFSLSLEVDEIAIAEAENALMRAQENYTDFIETQTKSQQDWIKEINQMGESTQKAIQMHQYTKAVEQYQRDVASQEKNIADQQEKLEKMKSNSVYTVTAPMDGMVTEVTKKNAEADFAPGDIMVTINSYDEVLLKVTDSDKNLRYGQAVTVSTQSGDAKLKPGILTNTVPGKVVCAPSSVSPEMADSKEYNAYILPSDTSYFTGMAEMNPSDMGWGGNWGGNWGQDAWANYNREFNILVQVVYEPSVLTVPANAVINENGKYYVYILEDGRLHKRSFTSGGNNASYYWVLEGIDEDATLAIMD